MHVTDLFKVLSAADSAHIFKKNKLHVSRQFFPNETCGVGAIEPTYK